MQLSADQNGINITSDSLEILADMHIEAEINRVVCDLHPHKRLILEREGK